MASFGGLAIEKLCGRENYNTWAFAVKNYLQHEELWDYVSGDVEPEKFDKKLDTKARTKIVLFVDCVNYVHIQDADTAKDVWTKLKTTFEDSGLTRRVGLLRQLVTLRLENCENIEQFVNNIITTAHKLTNIGFPVSDEWVGTLLLAGLPEHYSPMIMGIESSGINITADSIKTKLLQDVKKIDSGKQNVFVASYSGHKKYKQKQVKCYGCGGLGHFKVECPSRKNKNSKSDDNKVTQNVRLCSVFSINQNNSVDWFIDSGASMHMSMREEWFENIHESEVKQISVANNETLSVKFVGDINIKITVNNCETNLTIQNVLYIPQLKVNLLSVSQMMKHGYSVKFYSDRCRVMLNNEVIMSAKLCDRMYKLDRPTQSGLLATAITDSNLWHLRMAHLNFQDLVKLRNIADGLNFSGKLQHPCVPCLKGKQCRLPFKDSQTRSTKLLEKIHSDLCGPMETISLGGAKYFVTFIDDFSRKVFIYFLNDKSNVKSVFENFKVMVEKETGGQIKCLRTDNGTEFCNRSFKNYLLKTGIRHETTVPYTPQQNGLAERMNRTIVEKSRCMLFTADLDKTYWAEAAFTAVFLINRSPTTEVRDKTPHEVWSGVKPDLSTLRVFGCKAMAHVPKEKRQKWDAKAQELIFVGYCDTTKGYRLIKPKTHKLVVSRDVIFLEDNFNFDELQKDKVSTINDVVTLDLPDTYPVEDIQNIILNADHGLSDDQDLDTISNSEYADAEDGDVDYIPSAPSSNVNENTELRRSARTPKPVRLDDYVVYSAAVEQNKEPETVEEALNSEDSQHWKKAMQDEFDSLIENDTWTLVKLPTNKRVINSKWVFKTKPDVDGNIEKYKARLVIKGCSQKQGIDYQETFSPVVRYTSIRYLLSLAVKHNLNIDQMDAVSAFLQGEVNEEIYMKQPDGFTHGDGTLVCRLNKAIYGLKQASREWNKKLHNTLIELGLQQSRVDPCVYYSISEDSGMLFVCVYVDDLLVFSNNDLQKSKLKEKLMERFKMKDLGEAKSCVGLRIRRNRETGEIFVDQERYTKEILDRFKMADCNPIGTPFDCNQKLEKPKTSVEDLSKIPYQEAVGSLLYLVQGTRPDLAFAVTQVSRFSNDFDRSHWSAVKRIFRYLKGTSDLGLVFSPSGEKQLTGYTDADWASDVIDRRSCTGYVFTLQGAAVSWNSKRQQTVALSSTEAEYMAVSAATQEAEWLRQFENEFWPKQMKPVKIHCDNRSAINLSLTDAYHARTKHIDVRHHFVRQKVQDGYIRLIPVGTGDMAADALTKPVAVMKHNFCRDKFGLQKWSGK